MIGHSIKKTIQFFIKHFSKINVVIVVIIIISVLNFINQNFLNAKKEIENIKTLTPYISSSVFNENLLSRVIKSWEKKKNLNVSLQTLDPFSIK